MFIGTTKQLSEAIIELTPWQWATPEVVARLTTGEFKYITTILPRHGTEMKIREILERANRRKEEAERLIELRKIDDIKEHGLSDEQIDYLYNQ